MNKKYLIEQFNIADIEISEHQVDQFIKYYELLVDWNSRMNLTAITDFEEVVVKHFIDSILSLKYIDFKLYGSLIDVGTGAGFPGVPLKIMFPHLNITLLDSLSKRCDFLKTVRYELGFEEDGFIIVHGRAEDFGKDPLFREKFDLCVSRAVSNLNVLCEYCIPFIKLDGFFISYKGDKGNQEAEAADNAIKTLGGKIERIESLNLQNLDIMRIFVFIRKINNTESKYPRRSGTPEKKPLK